MNLLVKSFAPYDELKKATEQINTLIKAIGPYKVSLNNDSRNGMRVVGSSRLGLVEIVSKLSLQYDNKLAKDEKGTDLSERATYLRALRAYKLAANHLSELLDDTDKALGSDVMTYVDKFSGSLRKDRKFDGDLDEALKELDDYNARFGKIMEEEDKNGETKDDNTPK